MTIRRRCACSVVIEAQDDPESIEHAVQVHREQPEHAAYIKRYELRRELVTAPRVLVRRLA